MNLPLVLSKRHRRIRSIKDCEPGLPYTEIISNEGQRINLCKSLEYTQDSSRIPSLPINNDVIHSKLLRMFPELVKIYSKHIINLPTKFILNENEVSKVEEIRVDSLIIGGGTSALGALSELSGKERVLMITAEVLGNLRNENMPLPQTNREDFIKILNSIIKDNKDKIIEGILLGKFDEGIAFRTNGRILIVNSNRVFLATGGRYIPPIFSGNDTPGVISKNLYFRLREKINRIEVVGNSDDAVRVLLSVNDSKKILINNGILFLSKYYRELIESIGIEILKTKTLRVHRTSDGLQIFTDEKQFYSDALVYAVIKQPKVDHAYNIGLSYSFDKYLHIYMPNHSIEGKANENVYIIGGMRGISDEYTSFLSGKASVNSKYLDEFIDNMKTYNYIFNYYDNSFIVNSSPYLYGDSGYVCECEDVTYDQVNRKIKDGFNSVEEIKRVTGLGTGECQGKICTYIVGSITKSENLITFRSPLYRLVI
ncbi:(2Fe-2S)-binding protein [Sulfolobus sp. A20]|uniref:(2Fe-2S)-binding protein n=1 Tax=Saccharolobus sp. A20 TaxID=1891280 RepID=UPI000845CD13|nr:(2Fe-2S)-binding protein [Sulfolobus sp. A20]TRM78005.1 (2Fe-2S)-binding protein [Sulfolobus sp. B5]TRM82525.1 (2Fe-2S)-binding protein [Sulfolobus sp. D5]TRM83039.1 (2Fe-2S)-binding protein [Sulfolobus sp. A20-N-F6]TRM87861.1 (2Fe-2S)-binding protein [Sulfolobus sp. C3]TRM93496.1 (2Fe-2S)-binding protein [Sulfolobus sp. A20-N-G8]TRN01833.1 (2Fe-2S)-binding protein [Sulfolobus sp. E1]